MGFKDITGMRYGKIRVLSRAENSKYGEAQWNCVCDCGKKFVANGARMRSGKTRSCGCLQKETASLVNKIHGLSRTHIFKVWCAMRQRCYNPNAKCYKDYGAKGIKLCDEWMEFQPFYNWAIQNGYSDDLTIDRIDNKYGYSPDNCRWVTREQQNRNTTRVHRIKSGDGYITAAQAAELFSLSRTTVAKWCRLGYVKTVDDVRRLENSVTDVKHKRNKKENK